MTVIVVGQEEKDLRKYAHNIRQIAEGRLNANGLVTLTTSATSTSVTAPNCSVSSGVWLFPASTAAATEFTAGTLCVKQADVKNGSFTITHVRNNVAGRLFYWVALG